MTFPKLNKKYWISLSGIAAIWSLPIWTYVIIDAVRLSKGLPVVSWERVQMPGILLSVYLSPHGVWAGMHDYTWTEVGIYGCLFYYVVVALLVMLWRRVRRSKYSRTL